MKKSSFWLAASSLIIGLTLSAQANAMNSPASYAGSTVWVGGNSYSVSPGGSVWVGGVPYSVSPFGSVWIGGTPYYVNKR